MMLKKAATTTNSNNDGPGEVSAEIISHEKSTGRDVEALMDIDDEATSKK